MDELTHKVTVIITGEYPHGEKEHARVEMRGSGDLSFMISVFSTALISAGFSLDVVKKIEKLNFDVV